MVPREDFVDGTARAVQRQLARRVVGLPADEADAARPGPALRVVLARRDLGKLEAAPGVAGAQPSSRPPRGSPVHVGSGPNHGHYVALVRAHNRWLCFDDDVIEWENMRRGTVG